LQHDNWIANPISLRLSSKFATQPLETVSDSKVRGASQEIFALAGEKMTVVDDMLDELYRQLSDVDRMLEAYASKRE